MGNNANGQELHIYASRSLIRGNKRASDVCSLECKKELISVRKELAMLCVVITSLPKWEEAAETTSKVLSLCTGINLASQFLLDPPT
jgi:hypothetical protein